MQKTDACKKPEFTIPHYTGGEDDWSSGGEDWRPNFMMLIITSHLKHSMAKDNLNKAKKAKAKLPQHGSLNLGDQYQQKSKYLLSD